jgi:HEAT repeat protein
MLRNPRPLLALLLLLLCAALAAANQSDAARASYEQAQELIQRGRFGQAERELQTLLERYPDDEMAAEALYWRAFALYRLGFDVDDREELREAQELLRQALAKNADAQTSGDARALLARLEGKLASLGDREAAKSTRDRVDAEDDELKMAALNALIHMDSERALPILKRILREPEKYPRAMREQAVFLIAQHADEDASDILLEIARSDTEPEIRENAIFWLSQVDNEGTLDVLSQILETERDSGLQEKAIFAISQHDSPRSAELLRQIALDEKYADELRGYAIFWLGQRSEADSEFLRELFPNLDSAELKEKVLFAASQQGGKAQAEFLQRVLHDENEATQVRNQALFWLGQSGLLDVKGLAGLYSSLKDTELRSQAIFAISQQGGADAVDALMQIARTEKNRELRENAVFWLGQMDDERAAKLLEEIIAGGGE